MKKGLLGMVLAFALALLLGVMIGCPGDSGGGGGIEGYSARGTYIFTLDPVDGDSTPPVGDLLFVIEKSSFPKDCGPQVGDTVEAQVDALTVTAIEFSGLDFTFIGVRSPAGELEDVVGEWVGTMGDIDHSRWILEEDLDLIIRFPWAICR